MLGFGKYLYTLLYFKVTITKEAKMTRSIIFLFLILFLTLTPVTAEEEPLDIDIEFPAFYEVNISGALAKNIGVAGLSYPVTVKVSSAGEEVNLTNRDLEIRFTYSRSTPQNRSIFLYNKIFIENTTFNVTFNLTKELRNGKCSCFQFNIGFLEMGWYVIEWREILGNEEMEEGDALFISITGPMEYENLVKQSQLLDAEKKSAESSEKSANYSKWGAIVTAVLAGFTLLIVVVSYLTLKQIQKDREVDLLRRRLGNLYSMLKYNKDSLNQKLPFQVSSKHLLYKRRMDFYTKFRESLYLGSKDLVDIAEKFLEYIEQNKVPQEKEEEFKEIREKLIKQIDSDYDKYLKKLLRLTKKPKWWWNVLSDASEFRSSLTIQNLYKKK
jgi:hypothetical protein